jgi:hypothetical protein
MARGFFLSSPDVTDERSGSASDAFVLMGGGGRRADVVLAAGRVGGLLMLEPTVLVRDEALVGGRAVVVEARGVVVEAVAALAVGRRTPPSVPPATERRGGAGSFAEAGELEDEAMVELGGVEGAVAFCSPLEVGDARWPASLSLLAALLAGVGRFWTVQGG